MSTPTPDYFADLIAQVAALKGPPAWELLERAAREHPRDPRPLGVLAGHLMNAQKTDAAEGAYISALQRAPDFAVARFQLGLLHLTSGRPAAALATWAPLELLGDQDPFCLFKRGLEAMALDRFADAHRWLAAGIAANTTNAPLNRDMQMFIDQMAREGLLPADGAAPAPARSGDDGAPSSPDDAHFLVSTYGQKV